MELLLILNSAINALKFEIFTNLRNTKSAEKVGNISDIHFKN